MLRLPLLLGLCCAAVCGTGCQSAFEQQTIEQFALAMTDADLEGMRGAASERFERQALRREDAVDDFAVLRIPKGTVEVLKIEDVSETEKLVQVGVGAAKRKILYRLTFNQETESWEVDDIFLKQKRDGVVAQKAVTEQMDLLLTIREWLTDWQAGNTRRLLSDASPDLSTKLRRLPPETLAGLMQKIVGERAIERGHRPEAQLDEDHAVVRLGRIDGHIMMSFNREGSRWVLDDLAVESRNEEDRIPSLRKLAIVLAVGSDFLTAYAGGDRKGLEQTSTPTLYSQSLDPGDLKSLPLPMKLTSDTMRARTFPEYAEIVVQEPNRTCKLSLRKQNTGDDVDAPVEFRVEDVTIYDLQTREQILLSSYFNAQAIVNLFGEFIRSGDVGLVKKVSTPTLSEAVWDALGPIAVRDTPLSVLLTGSPVIKKTEFRGQLTRVVVQQGRFEMTYLLRNWNGKTLVDDIEIPNPATPKSLRETMLALLPVKRFEHALQNGSVEEIRRVTSLDFNRQVWSQTGTVPSVELPYGHALSGSINSIDIQGEQATVSVGTPQRGAKIMLTRYRDRLLIDDVLLLSGPNSAANLTLKRAFRERLGELGGTQVGSLHTADRLAKGHPSEMTITPRTEVDPFATAFAPQDVSPQIGSSGSGAGPVVAPAGYTPAVPMGQGVRPASGSQPADGRTQTATGTRFPPLHIPGL